MPVPPQAQPTTPPVGFRVDIQGQGRKSADRDIQKEGRDSGWGGGGGGGGAGTHGDQPAKEAFSLSKKQTKLIKSGNRRKKERKIAPGGASVRLNQVSEKKRPSSRREGFNAYV